jgi:DNA-binding XRE family transcriptional regulator
MKILNIADTKNAGGIDCSRMRNAARQCIYYKEEGCSAPKLRFRICRACPRIDFRLTIRDLFSKIKIMAAGLLQNK